MRPCWRLTADRFVGLVMSIEAMGGDPKVMENPERVLPQAPVVRPIRAPRSGVRLGTMFGKWA